MKIPEHQLAKAALPKSTMVSVWTSTVKSYIDNFIRLHTGHPAETQAHIFVVCARVDFLSFDKLQGLVL